MQINSLGRTILTQTARINVTAFPLLNSLLERIWIGQYESTVSKVNPTTWTSPPLSHTHTFQLLSIIIITNTVNLEIFVVKYFRSRWQLRKLILRKLACTINAHAVRGRSYQNIFTQKFIVQTFLYMKISRSTVAALRIYNDFCCHAGQRGS